MYLKNNSDSLLVPKHNLTFSHLFWSNYGYSNDVDNLAGK